MNIHHSVMKICYINKHKIYLNYINNQVTQIIFYNSKYNKFKNITSTKNNFYCFFILVITRIINNIYNKNKQHIKII